MGEVVSLLDREVYAMGQVDRLLGVSAGTARRWIDGYERLGRRYEPLIRSETTGSDVVTWGEFVETRLIAEYRRHGVAVTRMRPAIMALRREFDSEYPLATAKPFLSAEGQELVMAVQEETGLSPALRFVLRTRQSLLGLSMEVRRFHQDAEYEDTNEVQRLRVLGTSNVVLDPERGFGEPTIRGRRLRVSSIAEAISTGQPRSEIKDLWNISDEMLEDALRCSLVA